MDIPVVNLMLPLNSSVFIRGRNHRMSLQNRKQYFQAYSVYIHSQFLMMEYQSKPQEGRRRLSRFSSMRLLLLIEIYNLILNTSLDPYTRSITLTGWIKEKTRSSPHVSSCLFRFSVPCTIKQRTLKSSLRVA